MPRFAKSAPAMGKSNNLHAYGRQSCTKQFWKAGDPEYEGALRTARNKIDSSSTDGFDHARMHPKFLHSNATSHKWALGAFAELLDNALDEVHNGATYVNIDVHSNKKDGSKLLLVQDNGGGMDPEKMRKCMSLGFSEKSKMADTIGQYGNGFKTSTMRLGADVIVFSRTERTQSIGLLSYTFLRSTAKEDTVVPMLDYEKRRGTEPWTRMFRSSSENWDKNLETIKEWSPFESEEDLKRQFTMMNTRHGTRIIIYNLWEDDEGNLELDLDSEPHDIQMRGVNRDEKSIEMAEMYPNSRHFLTYRHSLRSYASILYLRLPTNFRIILRGRDVKHHNILSDLMWSEQIMYRPKILDKEEAYITRSTKKEKDTNMVAKVTLGFVKDAENHLDVQGFNVYHRNRLITPFWRVWNAAGSDGRGVIGVIEADYINPAHDKQGFEHTILLDRLKQKIAESQKLYWSTNCHKIGYAPRRNKRAINEERQAANKSGSQSRPALDSNPDKSSSRKRPLPDSNTNAAPQKSQKVSSDKSPNGNGNIQKKNTLQATTKSSTRRPEVVLGLSSSKPQADMQKPSSATGKTSSGNAKTKVATSDKQANGIITDKATKSSENADEVVHHSNMEEDSQSEQESTPCGTNGPVTTTSGASNTIRELRAQLQKANEESKKLNMQQDKGARQQKEEYNLLKKELRDAYNQLQKANEEIKKLNMQQEESTRRQKEENSLNSLLKKEIRDAYNKLQKVNEEIKKLNIQQDESAQRQKEENSFLKKELQDVYNQLRKANDENSALIELLQEEREKMQHSTREVVKM